MIAAPLTPREREVLDLLCREPDAGRREIAHQLGISVETYRNHSRSIVRKMGRATLRGAVLEYDRTLR